MQFVILQDGTASHVFGLPEVRDITTTSINRSRDGLSVFGLPEVKDITRTDRNRNSARVDRILTDTWLEEDRMPCGNY